MQLAILSTKTRRYASQRPIPAPGPNEVLIRNVAVASNPKDWKGVAAYDDWQDQVEGNDVAGYVEAVGAEVRHVKTGDRVAAATPARKSSDAGAYQQYTLAPGMSTFLLEEHVSFEDAATLPLAIMTAAIGLYQRLKLPLPSATPTQQNAWIAINGASSSVGSFTLQLAKLSGLKVLATAGASCDQVRALGADEILDYRTLDLDDLAHHFRTKQITHVFDAASTEASQKLLAAALQANGGGELAVVLAPPKLDADRVNVEPLVRVGTSYTTERTFATEWYATFGRWLNEGVIKPNKVRPMPNGLDSVDEGLRLLEQGKVSGEKLVYRIADTPALQ